MAEAILKFFVITTLLFSIPGKAITERPPESDWCQCVVFILNLLGIQQIPGEYWTAASLAVPDESGMTWMDYQGYSQRDLGEKPLSGDLLILAGGAKVITEQAWSGENHLVPVAVDSWAGHIGIIENASERTIGNNKYWQIRLLSANWGVNAQPAGVIGSCYNVDESEVLLPVDYKKVEYFFATDPEKMRERIVNRAERWAMLGIAPNPNTLLDGFPIEPVGFLTSALKEPGLDPLHPVFVNEKTDLIEIPWESLQPGDVVIYENPAGQKGNGIIKGMDRNQRDLKYMYVLMMNPDSRVQPLLRLKIEKSNMGYFAVEQDGVYNPVHFMRYMGIPGYVVVPESGVTWANAGLQKVSINFSLINGGGKPVDIIGITVQLRDIDGFEESSAPIIQTRRVDTTVLGVGEYYTYSVLIEGLERHNYWVDVFYELGGEKFVIKNTAEVHSG